MGKENKLGYIITWLHTYSSNLWCNGKKGSISDPDGEWIFRFFEPRKDKNGDWSYKYKPKKDFPIVCTGIAACWLWRRKRKSVREIFDDYTEVRFKKYKEEFGKISKTWKWESADWKRNFYCNYIIPHEKELNDQSESLFDYITKSDAEEVRPIMDCYMEYLEQCKDEITLKQEDEIVKQLVPYFSSEQNAKKYVEQIKGLKDTDIVIITNKYWDASFISEEATPTAIWRVLHDNGIYTSGDRNWRNQVKFNLI